MLKFILFLFLFFMIERFCHRQTDGFSITKIHSNLAFHPEWDVGEISIDEKACVEKILSQPFSYLASGGSCYVFASQDGRYVLKLFKHHHLDPMTRLQSLPLPSFLRYKLEKRAKKRERVFSSCKSAFTQLKEMTGLVYVQLNKQKLFKTRLTLIDKLGIKHEILLDEIEFLLQKKAEMAYSHIDRLIAYGDLEGAEAAVSELSRLVQEIAKSGFKDLDPNLDTNFGFIGNQAVKIDVGPLVQGVEKRPGARLKKWIKLRYPQLESKDASHSRSKEHRSA